VECFCKDGLTTVLAQGSEGDLNSQAVIAFCHGLYWGDPAQYTQYCHGEVIDENGKKAE
jgi:hypothetical protein